MNPRFACADFTFPLLSHEQVLDLIAMLGFEGVDIGLFEGRSHLQPSGEFRNVRKSARALGRKLADRGLKPADIFLQTAPEFVSLAPNHPDPRRRARARRPPVASTIGRTTPAPSPSPRRVSWTTRARRSARLL
jgi:sugar phosphate isomerase/epimerase